MGDKIKINDVVIRIIGIQFFGIVIPNATGLFDNTDKSITHIMLAYGFFMLIAFLIWQGNRFFLFRLQEKFDWFIHPIQKVVVLLAMNVFYTAPLVICMLYLWYKMNSLPVDWVVIQITTVVCVICVIFITHVYETVFLIKQRENDIVKGEQLERAKAQAELEALKNQIDPHFMFNSLNSLSYLIEHNTSEAKKFTESLAEVYRYILSNKDQTLVILEDELTFLDKYIAMLDLRFKAALQVDFSFQDTVKSEFLIPPISIFIAVENAVKHNEISKTKPLVVEVKQFGDWLSISNKKVRKKSLLHSSKIGLKNLDERFKIIVGKGIKISNTERWFELQLPMLKLHSQ
ncbi:sensor histidine kinase [Fulvivirgaceae bacterium BMA12]|uniref:Sensor histidine kinase n=1 Tax=Agaribacillus aureus TaxID=3051825 RepID=A0ABT8LFU2_9BACT|nr:sensor histidine kinase [Fulvivirgaceae bacterium BMA12]